MKHIFAAACLMLMSCASFAQHMQAEGEFYSGGVRLRTIMLDDERGVITAYASVVSEGCSGHVSGIGKITGRTLVFAPYVKVPGWEACKMTAVFDAAWEHVKVTEGTGCLGYHGEACAFEGQVATKVTPKR